MKLRAPAKVNLHLRVIARRPDGFHNIETLMVPVGLADEVSVEISDGPGVDVTCEDPAVPQGESNLAARAAREFSRQTGREFAVRIHIVKRIPMGAGLGGGSSDAAAVLTALDVLLETRLGVDGLERIAAEVGADVAFFIRRHPAWCRARGEVIEPFRLPESLPLLLVKPPFGVETAWAYRSWAASHSLPGGFEEEQDLGWVRIVNSLERPVFEKFLLLPVLKRWLCTQPEVRAAAMSGSGSTCFAILRDRAAGEAVARRAKAEFGATLWTSCCETLDGGAKSDAQHVCGK